VWEKFGPYSCQLNIDEVDNIEETWEKISKTIGVDVKTVKDAIQPVKDMYIVLDHTRTVMMTIQDGSLPSNVGGGGNVRNILRRVFSILNRNHWWEKLTMEGLLELFEKHKVDLHGIYGDFPEYKSFGDIIKVEYDRWMNTDEVQKKNLDKLLKQRKGQLTIDDWIMCMQSYGIPADRVSEISGQPVPGNLYYEIATRQERMTKPQEQVLYNTVHLPETKNLYYNDHHLYEFDAKAIDLFENVTDKNKKNIIILDESAVYPTSGGQQNDTGKIKIEGLETEFTMKNAEKVGKVVFHIVEPEVPLDRESLKGRKVHVSIDQVRRS